MLPPFIIEQIRQREEREQARKREEQPRLELPVEPRTPHPKRSEDDDADRGVLILDIG